MPLSLRMFTWKDIIPPRILYGCLVNEHNPYKFAELMGRPAEPDDEAQSVGTVLQWMLYLEEKLTEETGVPVEDRWVYNGDDRT